MSRREEGREEGRKERERERESDCVANEPLVGDSTGTKQDRAAQSRGGIPSMPQRKKERATE